MRRPVARAAQIALALAAALACQQAAAYILAAPAVLKRLAQKREELVLTTFEVQGTLTLYGAAAQRAGELGLPVQPVAGGEASAPALLTAKVPGRCRLEAAPPDAAPAERPVALWRNGKAAGQRGLEQVAPAAALVQAVCLLLAERSVEGEPEQRYLQSLQALGVATAEVTLAQEGTRVALVIGGRAAGDKPVLWVDKQTFQPLRLAATTGGLRQEVRFVDWGSSIAGDQFPRAVEVWSKGQLDLRFSTERVTANLKVADGLF